MHRDLKELCLHACRQADQSTIEEFIQARMPWGPTLGKHEPGLGVEYVRSLPLQDTVGVAKPLPEFLNPTERSCVLLELWMYAVDMGAHEARHVWGRRGALSGYRPELPVTDAVAYAMGHDLFRWHSGRDERLNCLRESVDRAGRNNKHRVVNEHLVNILAYDKASRKNVLGLLLRKQPEHWGKPPMHLGTMCSLEQLSRLLGRISTVVSPESVELVQREAADENRKKMEAHWKS
eukprot:gene17721-24081_t